MLRSGKAAYNMFKIIHFSFASAWGFYVLHDQPYMPTFLGGHGDLLNMWIGYPYPKHAYMLKELILILMGYHVGGLLTHFLQARRTDFLEMALHHSVCVFLYGGCYLYNALSIGAVIALLHDISDISTSIIKVLAETNYTITTVITFLFHMLLWGYTRNYGLPYTIVKIWET